MKVSRILKLMIAAQLHHYLVIATILIKYQG